jgi:hypothetical protein
MIQDAKLLFSDAEALTDLNGSDDYSTNIIDLGAQANGKDAFGNALKAGIGKDITWFVNINVAMVTAAKIMTCTLVTGSAISSSAITSAISVASILFPALSPAGTKKAMKVDYGALKRYIAVNYTATPTLATVTVESGLIHGYNDSSIAAKFVA